MTFPHQLIEILLLPRFFQLLNLKLHIFGYRRVTELEGIMTRLEETSKTQVEEITARLHEKTSESSAIKLENDRLKVGVIICMTQT